MKGRELQCKLFLTQVFELIEIQDPTYTAKSDMECLHMYVYMFMYKSVL